MSANYLINIHANPLAGARILDVTEPTGGQSLLNGGQVIRVPDYISVQDPTNVTDLITKKYQGLLAFYAGFSFITFDTLLDSTFIDFAYPNLKGSFGDRGAVWLPAGGELRTVMVPLAGAPPTQAIVTWEAYSVQYTDPKTDRVLRTYVEESTGPGNFTCQVSFDNGANFYSTTDGAILNIPVLGMGTSFILSLVNVSGQRLNIGSWAVVYM
jgi:hypothetical protein